MPYDLIARSSAGRIETEVILAESDMAAWRACRAAGSAVEIANAGAE